MTVITFINVVLRYGFNTGLIWGLEADHLSVRMAGAVRRELCGQGHGQSGRGCCDQPVFAPVRRILALIAGAICIGYASSGSERGLGLLGELCQSSTDNGTLVPNGFRRDEAVVVPQWYEVVDIPMPGWLRWIEPLINEGEEYEKIPRFIPYAILPFRHGAAALSVCSGISARLERSVRQPDRQPRGRRRRRRRQTHERRRTDTWKLRFFLPWS